MRAQLYVDARTAQSGEVERHCYRIQEVLGRARVHILTDAEAKMCPIAVELMPQHNYFTLYVASQAPNTSMSETNCLNIRKGGGSDTTNFRGPLLSWIAGSYKDATCR